MRPPHFYRPQADALVKVSDRLCRRIELLRANLDDNHTIDLVADLRAAEREAVQLGKACSKLIEEITGESRQ